MNRPAIRVSATCIGKWSVDLAMLAERASRETEPCLIPHSADQALAMIGTIRRELTELETALRAEAEPAPKPGLRLVGDATNIPQRRA